MNMFQQRPKNNIFKFIPILTSLGVEFEDINTSYGLE